MPKINLQFEKTHLPDVYRVNRRITATNYFSGMMSNLSGKLLREVIVYTSLTTGRALDGSA